RIQLPEKLRLPPRRAHPALTGGAPASNRFTNGGGREGSRGSLPALPPARQPCGGATGTPRASSCGCFVPRPKEVRDELGKHQGSMEATPGEVQAEVGQA